MVRNRAAIALGVALVLAGAELRAQDPNLCDVAGERPDVVVGEVGSPIPWGNVGNVYGYSLATIACNVGTCQLNWIGESADHPVIAQNLYRLKDGRFTQIGQSWVKHGFAAFQQGWCSSDCQPGDGAHLGVNCSDPYSTELNGEQEGLGPRFEVNASTGEFPYPFSDQGVTGDAIYKRLQVHAGDLAPALNPGARYFAEGHYVSRDDAAAGSQNNNASYREVVLDPTNYRFLHVGPTRRERAALQAWRDVDPDVTETAIDVPGDGRFLVAARATALGGGLYHYEYAVQNLNSHRAAASFLVPIAAGATVSGQGFHDVDPHSGDLFDGLDWAAEHDGSGRRVRWSNTEANPLRWGTVYNFWFDADVAPQPGRVEIGLYLPPEPGGSLGAVSAASIIPDSCSHDGACQSADENCADCAEDCVHVGPPTGFCGDAICGPALGEDCTNCADCAGQQSGSPASRFCCGAGGGANPVGCSDPRCTGPDFACGDSPGVPACCGTGGCEPGESPCVCTADCGAAPAQEAVCADGLDDDCDARSDCQDPDCCLDPACRDDVDDDGDGVAACDCDDTNPAVWSTPGEVTGLLLTQDFSLGVTRLLWSPPTVAGGSALAYETLRSLDAADWTVSAVCLSDVVPTDTANVEPTNPPPDGLFLYLVRAENVCPEGGGPVGGTVEQSGAARRCP